VLSTLSHAAWLNQLGLRRVDVGIQLAAVDELGAKGVVIVEESRGVGPGRHVVVEE
jgi:hypothetical protein